MLVSARASLGSGVAANYGKRSSSQVKIQVTHQKTMSKYDFNYFPKFLLLLGYRREAIIVFLIVRFKTAKRNILALAWQPNRFCCSADSSFGCHFFFAARYEISKVVKLQGPQRLATSHHIQAETSDLPSKSTRLLHPIFIHPRRAHQPTLRLDSSRSPHIHYSSD